ncbi:MAG: hypothetical protein AAFX85_15435 [Pseudomonadota bacterium]
MGQPRGQASPSQEAALHAFRQHYAARDARADLNGDGVINIADLAALKQRWSPATAKVSGGEVFVSAQPLQAQGIVGAPVVIDLTLDFTAEPTLGGAVDVTLDPALTGDVSWTYATSNLGDDPFFRNPPDITPGRITGITVGSFDGLTGPGVIGSVVLIPTQAASGSVTPGASALSPWVADGTFEIQSPTYTASTLTVSDAAAVPISPMALALGFGALLCIGAWTQRARSPA